MLHADPGILEQLKVIPAADAFQAGTLADKEPLQPGQPARVVLPYILPLMQYSASDAPWCVDVEHGGLDRQGRRSSWRESLYTQNGEQSDGEENGEQSDNEPEWPTDDESE